MSQDFLIGKQSLLKVDSKKNYIRENKVQLSVDADTLKNRNYNRFDVSKDPASIFMSSPPSVISDTYVPAEIISTVQIGSQIWTSTNLKVSKYKNGDTIPEVTDQTTWNNLTTGAWCYYNNDSSIGAEYGKLYNWYAVTDPRGLAPEGFHIPSYSELISLQSYVGFAAGGKLKETGTTHWNSPNSGATNETGFTAFGGGYRTTAFLFLKSYGYFWSSTQFNASNAYYATLEYDDVPFNIFAFETKKTGMSVRCILD